MLLSMTGYGRGVTTYEGKTITIEIRSLNSKFTDIRFKLPQNIKDKEAEIRKIVSDASERGKVDVAIDVKSLNGEGEYGLNAALFKKYYQELSSIMTEVGMEKGDLMQSILRLPNVVANEEETMSDEEWQSLKDVLNKALDSFIQFRKDEGAAMEKDCKQRIKIILELIPTLIPLEQDRVDRLRKRMKQNMDEYVGKDKIDANRFEQEILYYLEKIDITEEKVRLEQHCKYFLEELNTSNTLKGRKLSFISQEMGREINTLGSKANSSDIQRVVVAMKDELEKIKEMVANSV